MNTESPETSCFPVFDTLAPPYGSDSFDSTFESQAETPARSSAKAFSPMQPFSTTSTHHRMVLPMEISPPQAHTQVPTNRPSPSDQACFRPDRSDDDNEDTDLLLAQLQRRRKRRTLASSARSLKSLSSPPKKPTCLWPNNGSGNREIMDDDDDSDDDDDLMLIQLRTRRNTAVKAIASTPEKDVSKDAELVVEASSASNVVDLITP
jgi:hypothetical protein